MATITSANIPNEPTQTIINLGKGFKDIFSEKKATALTKLETVGLFERFENSIYSFFPNFIDHYRDKPARTHFTIQYERISPQKSTSPSLTYNTLDGMISSSHIEALQNITIDEFIVKIQERSSEYFFPLINGTNPISYLDFVTNWSYTWDEETMHIVDKLVTDKIALNKIWFLINNDVPATAWQETLELPPSWVTQAYKKRI